MPAPDRTNDDLFFRALDHAREGVSDAIAHLPYVRRLSDDDGLAADLRTIDRLLARARTRAAVNS